MKRFIFKLVLFLLPLMVLAYPLDNWISDLLSGRSTDSGTEDFAVWNDIFGGRIEADIAIHGNSRAEQHFDTYQLAEYSDLTAYNFGAQGHPLRIPCLRNSLYLEHNSPPKLVILSVDYATLHLRPDFYRYEQVLPYMLGNQKIEEQTAAFKKFDANEFRWPLLRYAGEFRVYKLLIKKHFLKQNPDTKLVKEPKNLSPAIKFDMNQTLDLEVAYPTAVQPAAIDLLQRFVDDCERKNVRVVMAFSPACVLLEDCLPNVSKAHARLVQFADDNGLEFLDYTHSPFSQDPNNFSDWLHLTPYQSQLFANQFWQDLTLTKTYREINEN